MEAHGQGIDDLHLLHAGLELPGSGPLVALEAELHVLRGDGITVVEREPAAQLELVHLAVRALRPGLGQARPHLLPRQRAHQRIVDRVEHPEGCDLRRGGGRVEPARSDRDVPGHHRLACGWRRLAGRLLHPADRERGDRQEQADVGRGGDEPRPGTGVHGHPPLWLLNDRRPRATRRVGRARSRAGATRGEIPTDRGSDRSDEQVDGPHCSSPVRRAGDDAAHAHPPGATAKALPPNLDPGPLDYCRVSAGGTAMRSTAERSLAHRGFTLAPSPIMARGRSATAA